MTANGECRRPCLASFCGLGVYSATLRPGVSAGPPPG